MSRPPRAPTLRRLAFATLSLALLAPGCETPATGVLVVIGTDLDPTLSLTVTARVARGLDGGDGRLAGPWTRAPVSAAALDGSVTLPLSFGIVPGESPVDELVSVLVEGTVDSITLRRRAVFGFIPRQTGVLRVFLTQRCAEPAVGCLEPVRCSVQQLCEEQGLTCGNDGACVAIRAPLSDDPDASFGDVAPTEACGAHGQRCCTLGPGCAGANACVAGTCRRCADPEQRCCDGPELRPNGAACAPTSDPCRAAGTCADGVCGAVTDVADGLPCGAATGACQLIPTCMSGACTPRDTPDNTPCGAAPDACHRAPVCGGGACLAPAEAPNETTCDAAADVCHQASVCAAGVCTVRNAPDGTVCAPASGACLRARVCGGGQCLAAAAAPNGTVCEAARNPCEAAAVCSGGRCGGHAARPDDSPWGGGGFNRCCNGNPLVVNTAAHCGGCNIACRSGSCRAAIGHYYCRCTSNAQCAPGICRGLTPNANLCACENNGDCPAGMRCVIVSFNPNYCTF